MMLSKGLSLVYLVMCSELGVVVCTMVGITSEEEDALESFSRIRMPKNGSLFMSGSGATTSAIGAITSGAGRSTLDGGLSNSSNSG
ncbi:hypothetical protein Tco_0003711 [Tanacetum coccineum]